MTNATPLSNRDKILLEVDRLIKKTPFTREDRSRADVLLALADQATPEGLRLRKAKLTAMELEHGQFRTSEMSSDSEVEAEFRQYLLLGKNWLPPAGNRALSITPGTAGGYLAPASFKESLDVALRAYDGLFDAAGVWQSSTGSAIRVGIMDDTSAAATVVSENDESTEADTTFDSLSFGTTPTWRTGIVRVSRELANDSAFDLSTVLAKAFAVRFARGIGAAMVSNLVSSADTGVTTASTSAVTPAELLDCMSALDPAYWPNSSWCMNKNTLIALLKIGMVSDAAGQAVTMWTTGPLQLFDKPIHICPSMDDLGAGKTPVSFGDHSKLLRREVVGSLSIKQFNERYAEYGQYGYLGFVRMDSGLLKPASIGSPAVSQSPVQLVVCHA